MSRPSIITDEMIEDMCVALRRGASRKIACWLTGCPKTSFYDMLRDNESFRTRIERAEAVSGVDLIEKTVEQGGAWKILKNNHKEFKDVIEEHVTSTQKLQVIRPDGSKANEFDF